MKRLTVIRSQKGFSLMGTLVAIGIVGILSASISSMIISLNKENQRIGASLALATTSQYFFSLLLSPASWSKTISSPLNNPLFDCFNNDSVTCPTTAAVDFRLLDPAGSALLAKSSDRPGVSWDGTPCTGADLVNGNDSCPIAITTTWTPICGTPCVQPTASVEVQFQFKPKSSSFSINTKKYNIKMVKTKAGNQILAHDVAANTTSWTGPGGSLWNHKVTLHYVDEAGAAFFSILSTSENSNLNPRVFTVYQSTVLANGTKNNVFMGEEQRQDAAGTFSYRVQIYADFVKVSGGWDVSVFHRAISRLNNPPNSPEITGPFSPMHGSAAMIRY